MTCVFWAVLRLLGRRGLHGLGYEDHGEQPGIHGGLQHLLPRTPAGA